MNPITKIASDAPAVLLEGARLTRKLASDNMELVEHNEALERELTIHKLAMRMHERGLEPGMDINEKVAMLRDVEPAKLAAVEAAVEMSAGGFKLATLRVEEDYSSTTTGGQIKASGELGSSAHYDQLDNVVRSI